MNGKIIFCRENNCYLDLLTFYYSMSCLDINCMFLLHVFTARFYLQNLSSKQLISHLECKQYTSNQATKVLFSFFEF